MHLFFLKDRVTTHSARTGHFLKRYKDPPDTLHPSVASLGMKYHIKKANWDEVRGSLDPSKKVKRNEPGLVPSGNSTKGSGDPSKSTPDSVLQSKIKTASPKKDIFLFSLPPEIALNQTRQVVTSHKSHTYEQNDLAYGFL